MIWLKYCRRGVKQQSINQSIFYCAKFGCDVFVRSIFKLPKQYQTLPQINKFLSILKFKAFSMGHVIIVELIKLKILLDFLFIDIIQYKKYIIIDISKFSFFSQVLGPKMGLNNPPPFDYLVKPITPYFQLSDILTIGHHCTTVQLQTQWGKSLKLYLV